MADQVDNIVNNGGINPTADYNYLNPSYKLSNFLQFGNLSANNSDINFIEFSQDLELPDDLSQLLDKFITFHKYNDPPTAVRIALYTLLFLLGLLGNLVVIYIFARNRKMRTVTNSFLVNLSVCDLLVIIICIPFSVAMDIYDNWIYGNAMCKIVNFSQGLAVSASILTLTVISAERFYAIRRPLRARAFMSRTRIHKIIFGIWILSGFAVLPSLFVRQEQTVRDQMFSFTITYCFEQWTTPYLKHVYNFALLILLYIAPVSFICIGYSQIGLNLWRMDNQLHASISAAETENARANLAGRRKVAKMLFVMSILFAFSWLPLQVAGILLDFLHGDVLAHKGMLLSHIHSYFLWLGHSNSAINPICYCIMSASFKSALHLELRRCCTRTRIPGSRGESMMSMMSMTGSLSHRSTSNGAPGRAGQSRVPYSYSPVTNGCSAKSCKQDDDVV